MMDIKQINVNTQEGRLLMMALAALTVSPAVIVNGNEIDGRKTTPDEMLAHVKAVTDHVYADNPLDPFKAASDPLIRYLATEHHPHMSAIVTNTRAELVEGQKVHHTEDYLQD